MAILSKGQGVYIASGIHVTAKTGALIVKKNWINNGVFIHDATILRFAGDTQTIRGAVNTIYNNINIAGNSIATVKTPQRLKGILLCNGSLNAEGNLTLLSTSEQTALIDGSGNGEVLGNVTMQRYISRRFGYKYFGSPFQSATVSQFSNEIDLSASFPAFYKYDEDVSTTGWVRYVSDTGHLLPLVGYAANFGNDTTNITVDITGVVNNHGLSTSLYNHNNTFTHGFNLASNPYPSPIDWDATGWTRTNIDNAIYFFNAGTTDQYKGVYSSYINGVSSDGIANNIIPAMQGFFVHVTDGSYPVNGTLGLSNASRINNLNAGFHKYSPAGQYPLLRLTAGFKEQTTKSDPLVIYFEKEATNNFDPQFDALKLMNTDDLVPSIYATAPGVKLSIDALPSIADSILAVPLGVKTEAPGWVYFNLSQIENVPGDMGLFFLDMATGTCQDLRKFPEYKIYLNDGTYENRFYLGVYSKNDASVLQNDVFTVYGNNGKMFVAFNLLSGGEGDIVITNILGQVLLREHVNGYGLHEFNTPWSSGIYMVSYLSQSKKYTKKVFLGYQ